MKYLIEFLILLVIISITRIISDTYISGEIAGMLCIYFFLIINKIQEMLKENDYYETKEKNKRAMQRLKAFNEIIKLTRKYNVELTRAEINNKKVLIISGIVEE